jgi:heavy metal efflux system protein
MIEKIIAFALNQRAVTLMLLIAIVILGVHAIMTLPTDSFPDVSNIQVQIITEPESMATEEVESLVTVPIEYALNGLPYVQKVRSSSEFGLSVVTAIFDDTCDVYLARQLVQQRLSTLTFPPDVPRPQLGPVVSSFSQVFMYQVKSSKHNMIDLRSIQDWLIAKRLLSVNGIANVVTYGGFIKQYQIIVDAYKMRGYGFTLQQLMDVVSRSNTNVGGNFIETGDEEVIIRGIGRVNNVEDIENIVLREVNGTPVLVKNVAEVKIGPAFRRGSASMNGKGEAIIGIVMTRKGANTKDVVEKVEKRLQEIQKIVPDGVELLPFYSQKELVDKTTETVREILFFSGALVIIILTAILMHIPTALIVTMIIPLALLFSFFMMKMTGLSSNLMTLGAVDFGVVVDAGVVMVENIYRKLSLAYEHSGGKAINRLAVVTSAAKEVGRPIAFAIAIIVAVYLPLFTLEGVEGKMFHPLALTFIYALVGALIVSLTAIPLLCFWCLRGRLVEKHNPAIEWLKSRYETLLSFSVSHPKQLIVGSTGLLLASCCVLPFLGSEFMPSLDEGSIWLRMRFPASIAHQKTSKLTGMVEKTILKFPEATCAITRVGRSGMGSDVEGVDAADMYIGLKPKSQWTDHNKEHLVEQMAKAVSRIPGVMFSFSQPIADMIDDLITGMKADVGIKIFGDNLVELDQAADAIRSAVKKVPGSGDVSREPVIGAPELKISLRRSDLARQGLLVGDVQEVIQAALAGKVVSELIEGNKRFDILVRFEPNLRATPEAISNIIVQAPDGAQLPLKALANISLDRGALLINREDGQRRAAVMVNIRGRDLGSWVQEAQQTIAESVKLPPGFSIVWGGQFENQQRAMARLSIVVPVVLFLIFVLLFFTFNSVKNAGLIMLNIPFATIGGIVALWITHQPISVPAIIGFIAVFGVAVQNGVILISYIMQLQKEGLPLSQAISEGSGIRFRPVLMTATVAMMGLLPKLVSEGTGAEIQRPLATVVFGGLLTATVMTLLVVPSVYGLINRDEPDAGKPADDISLDELAEPETPVTH